MENAPREIGGSGLNVQAWVVHAPALVAPGEGLVNVLALRIAPENFAAQKATLHAAAQQGVPFCEVCGTTAARQV